ncbi:MAG: dicarboxylate/amino acid:cation symporter [Acidobacteria bacterium]|nr:dicarboxylate/amino acid:cation symporter [Acidobacteriota bacterium]
MNIPTASRSRLSRIAEVSLARWMLLAAVGGLVIGWYAPSLAMRLGWISEVFLRLIRMLVAPLLFGVLVPAIGRAGASRDVGRLGWKSLVVFELATTVALLIGWAAGTLLQPGRGLGLPANLAALPPPTSVSAVLVNAVPTSIFDAMARGDLLQIVVFCLLFGVAALSAGPRAGPVLDFADAVAAITFRCTHYVMWLAPAAVLAALATTVATNGPHALSGLTRVVGAAWLAELAFLAALGVVLAATGVPLRRFVAHVRTPFLVGFATSSSAAALPQALAGMERLGVSRRVLGFVAPLSLTLHMNGSAVYLGVATMFVAQAAQMPLPWPTQLLILLMLKLTSKGVTGIPRATVVILAALFEQFGLPLAGVTILIGVDALIDPIRTSVNVISHCAAPALVARWEGETLAAHES